MASTAEPVANPARTGWIAFAAAASTLVLAGLAGIAGAGTGYGFLALAGTLLLATAVLATVLFFTSAGDGDVLARWSGRLGLSGLASYGLGVATLAGYFTGETFAGRMEWHWILFGPMALATLMLLDMGIYRKIVRNNLPTWNRYRQFIRRELAEPAAMRKVLVDDVIVQRELWRAGSLRWIRHALIFWGFMGMFGLEIGAAFLREAVPAFGWTDIWRQPGHPLRVAFDAGFDLTGLLVLAGCLLSFAWRISVNGKPEQKFADTPTSIFLFVVVVTGFAVEALRIAPTVNDSLHAGSFVGVALARMLVSSGLPVAGHAPLWVLHAALSCLFIVYVPLKRMVHSCATPIGRLMNSQKNLLAAKKRGVIGAMLLRRPHPHLD